MAGVHAGRTGVRYPYATDVASSYGVAMRGRWSMRRQRAGLALGAWSALAGTRSNGSLRAAPGPAMRCASSGADRCGRPIPHPCRCATFFDVRGIAGRADARRRRRARPRAVPGHAAPALAPSPSTRRRRLRADSARRLLELRPGDLVTLGTKVADEGELNVAGQRVAGGMCGAIRGRAAFVVRSLPSRGDA